MPNQQSNQPVKKSYFNSPQFWVGILGGAIVLFFLVMVYLNASHVSGSELDTATWMVRDFSYRRDPFTRRQLTGIVREVPQPLFSAPLATPAGATTTTSTATASVTPVTAPATAVIPNSYWTRKHTAATQRWDLIQINGLQPTQGKAKILATLIQSNQQFWSNWSTEHKAKADVFWQAAKDFVDLGFYNELPGLFDLALVDLSDKEFAQAVSDHLRAAVENYRKRPESDIEANKLDAAEAILKNY